MFEIASPLLWSILSTTNKIIIWLPQQSSATTQQRQTSRPTKVPTVALVAMFISQCFSTTKQTLLQVWCFLRVVAPTGTLTKGANWSASFLVTDGSATEVGVRNHWRLAIRYGVLQARSIGTEQMIIVVWFISCMHMGSFDEYNPSLRHHVSAWYQFRRMMAHILTWN